MAAFAGDPTNAPTWYANIESVSWETPAPLTVGSRMDFVAHFLGRRLAYTYEVTELDPGRRLVMRTAQGPFPMETSYTWEATGAGTTRMTLRNRGNPTGFSRLAAPMIGRAMRRATGKDLARLKQLLESGLTLSASLRRRAGVLQQRARALPTLLVSWAAASWGGGVPSACRVRCGSVHEVAGIDEVVHVGQGFGS